MIAAVMRWAGDVEAVRRDMVMGVLLISGTGVPRFRKSKALSPLVELMRICAEAWPAGLIGTGDVQMRILIIVFAKQPDGHRI